MPDLILRDIEPAMLERVQRLAAARGWSVQQALVWLLDRGLASSNADRRGLEGFDARVLEEALVALENVPSDPGFALIGRAAPAAAAGARRARTSRSPRGGREPRKWRRHPRVGPGRLPCQRTLAGVWLVWHSAATGLPSARAVGVRGTGRIWPAAAYHQHALADPPPAGHDRVRQPAGRRNDSSRSAHQGWRLEQHMEKKLGTDASGSGLTLEPRGDGRPGAARSES